MKRIALLAILAFTSLIAYSKYVIVNVEIPGTLDYEVAKQADWKTVDSLKVIGGINGTDVRTYRRMGRGREPAIVGGSGKHHYYIYNEIAGTYVGNTTEGKLKYLDLSEANIVAGGDAYATAVYAVSDGDEKIVSVGGHTKDCYTEDNVVGSLMLSGEFSEVIFPNSATRIDAWPIGSIAWESLKKVKVPDSVRVLPEMLLWGFENLEYIELPSVLEGIGSQAFSYTKVGFGFKMNIEKFPESLRYIGAGAFYEGSYIIFDDYLKDISNLVYIGNNALQSVDSRSWTSLRMPSVVYLGSHKPDEYGRRQFYNPWEIADLTFSREACKSITDTRILEEIAKKPFFIGQGFFTPVLRSMKVRIDNPEMYGDTICVESKAFKDFSELNLEIPEGQWIRPEESSFEGCAKLESLPLSKVSRNVVKGCSSLRTLNLKTSKIDTKEEEYGYRLEDVAGWFEGCTSLQNFNGPAELVGAKVGLVTKDGCLFYNDGEKTRLLIYPWGRKNMDYTEDFANHYDGAFKYCSEIVAFNLKSGDFPVREMLNFPNLKSVTVEPSTRYKVIDDIVYEKGWTDEECGALVCYPEYRVSFETLTIENSWLPYAFYGKYPTLRTVIIPRTITEIKGLLPNAENLLKIVCESTTPPTLDEESLQYTREKFGAIVVVPKGASSNYKKADYWKEFNIIEYDSVDDVADGAVVVAADGRMLMVAGTDGQRIDVFSADGRQVYSGTDSSVELPQAGVYVVRTGAVVKKIAVR